MPTKPTDGSNWSSWGSFVDAFVRGATTVGKALLSATDGAAARSAIGAGTASSKSDVGLGNVDNTADTAKPVSTAQASQLVAKADGPGYQTHDGTAGGGTRKTGYAYIVWRGGTSRPTNMVAGDEWSRDA